MTRAAVVALLLAASSASAVERWARGIDGVGRITVGGGWRLVPNDWFFARAEEQGYPTITRGIGGPQVQASFGYGATSFIEASIDLFFGYDHFAVQGYQPLTALAYGALLGVRFTFMDTLFKGFAPYLGFGVGPTLGYVFDGMEPPIEKLITGISANAGLTYRFSDHLGVSLDYRFLYARANWYPAGVNVGGSWFSVGVVIYFPRTTSDTSGVLRGP